MSYITDIKPVFSDSLSIL